MKIETDNRGDAIYRLDEWIDKECHMMDPDVRKKIKTEIRRISNEKAVLALCLRAVFQIKKHKVLAETLELSTGRISQMFHMTEGDFARINRLLFFVDDSPLQTYLEATDDVIEEIHEDETPTDPQTYDTRERRLPEGMYIVGKRGGDSVRVIGREEYGHGVTAEKMQQDALREKWREDDMRKAIQKKNQKSL